MIVPYVKERRATVANVRNPSKKKKKILRKLLHKDLQEKAKRKEAEHGNAQRLDEDITARENFANETAGPSQESTISLKNLSYLTAESELPPPTDLFDEYIEMVVQVTSKPLQSMVQICAELTSFAIRR